MTPVIEIVVVGHTSPPVIEKRPTDDRHNFYYSNCFVIGEVGTCLEVFCDLMFLWIFPNFCLLNLLLVRSYQAGITIVKRLVQGRNNMTRYLRGKPRLCDQGHRNNNAFTYSAVLPTRMKNRNNGEFGLLVIKKIIFNPNYTVFLLAARQACELKQWLYVKYSPCFFGRTVCKKRYFLLLPYYCF